jgi:hypothetical protein
MAVVLENEMLSSLQFYFQIATCCPFGSNDPTVSLGARTHQIAPPVLSLARNMKAERHAIARNYRTDEAALLKVAPEAFELQVVR